MDESRGEPSYETPSDAYVAAIGLWKRVKHREAVALLEQVANGAHGPVDAAFVQRVFRKLLNYASRMDWRETERLAREAIERAPGEAFGHRYLGEALMHQGQPEQARLSLRYAVDLDPLDEDARVILTVLERGAPKSERTGHQIRPWPARQQNFNDPRRVIERYILSGYPARPFVHKGTTFMTMGSCFAENLADRLERAGYGVHSEKIGEEINSTYANRYLLDWIENGPGDGPTRAIDEVFGPARRERLRRALQSSQALILTLGVAPCFEDRETGEFAFSTLGSAVGRDDLIQRCRMRTTTVAENVANLVAILESAERIAGHELQVVLTVSPVPLAATMEHYSAVLADCVSKSTLRLACEEVLQKRPGTIYWPSFEIVRWFGAHYSEGVSPVFGADDNISRHVSTWLVDLIVEQFISVHSLEQAPLAESEPAL
jgi:hypothetical protein